MWGVRCRGILWCGFRVLRSAFPSSIYSESNDEVFEGDLVAVPVAVRPCEASTLG